MTKWVAAVLLLAGGALLPACDEGARGESVIADDERRREGVIALRAEEGFVIATGEVVRGPAAGIRQTDLMAFAHNGSVSLVPGDPHGGMIVFRTAGKRNESFESLEDVPEVVPGYGQYDTLLAPQVGWAFAIKGNVTDGTARFRVVEVPDRPGGPVKLEYEAIIVGPSWDSRADPRTSAASPAPN